MKELEDVRVLIRYDVEALSEATYEKALVTVFSEPPVDTVYEGTFDTDNGDRVFSVEYLPGQFDQRADSAEQCVKLLNEKRNRSSALLSHMYFVERFPMMILRRSRHIVSIRWIRGRRMKRCRILWWLCMLSQRR